MMKRILLAVALLCAGLVSAQAQVIYPDAGAVSRTTNQVFDDLPHSIKGFGAACNGTTNDAAKVALAEAAGPYLIPADCSLRIATNTTISKAVTVQQGATIIADNATITIYGQFNAPPAPIFTYTGSGTVSFPSTVGANAECYSEWWGAFPNANTLSGRAINRALQACLNVRLLGGSYLAVDDSGNPAGATVLLNRQSNSLRGQPNWATVLGNGSTTANTVKIQGNGSSFGDYVPDVSIEDVYCVRTVTPATPALQTSDDTDGAACVRVSQATRPTLKRVRSFNDFIGFYAGQTLDLISENTLASRVVGSAGDRWYSWYLDDLVTAAAPNGSIRITDAFGGAQGFAGTSYCIYVSGYFADTFLFRPECAGATHSFWFEGPTGFGLPDNVQTIDVQIVNPIIDVIPSNSTGLTFKNIPKYGSITVIGGYGAMTTGTVNSSIMNFNTARGVTVKGFQFISPAATSSTNTCLSITSSNQISVEGLWQDCYKPVVSTSSTEIEVTGKIYNDVQTGGLTGVSIVGGNYNLVDVSIDGSAAGKFAVGVALDATTSLNEVRTSLIPVGVVTAKSQINGVTVASDGYAASLNLYSGVTNKMTMAEFIGPLTGNAATATNASTATALQTARTINGVSFNGTANVTVAAAASTLTGSALASGVTSSSLTSFGAAPTLGTPASGVLTNATGLPLGSGVTGTLPLANGGTAQTGLAGQLGVAWTTYTPTATCWIGCGTVTTSAATGRYQQIGKSVCFFASVTLNVTSGAPTGWYVSLPATAQGGTAANATYAFPGINYTTSAVYQAFSGVSAANVINVFTSAGAAAAPVTGNVVYFSGCFEST